MSPPANKLEIPVWRQPDGQPVSCVDKIKVLNENLAELQQIAQDALEDAILIGCDEAQVREVLQRLDELARKSLSQARRQDMSRRGLTIAIGFALSLSALPAAADPYDTVILETLDKIPPACRVSKCRSERRSPSAA